MSQCAQGTHRDTRTRLWVTVYIKFKTGNIVPCAAWGQLHITQQPKEVMALPTGQQLVLGTQIEQGGSPGPTGTLEHASHGLGLKLVAVSGFIYLLCFITYK